MREEETLCPRLGPPPSVAVQTPPPTLQGLGLLVPQHLPGRSDDGQVYLFRVYPGKTSGMSIHRKEKQQGLITHKHPREARLRASVSLLWAWVSTDHTH